ncbi:MAG: TraM recognition domain-containing protein, partial [Parcubacteria group bacterium]|nr:TraM recognition domain-containing protein [Parcubacteria group bacterium]
RYPEQKTFVINELINIFDKLFDLKATGGPMFEQYARNAMLLIMEHPESGSTLMEIPKVLADAEFRKFKLEHCQNQIVKDFWTKEAEKAGGEAALANIVPYVTSKLTPFISNDIMRPIIAQQKSTINLRDIMDNKKILFLNLSKGVIGDTNSYLLGMVLVGKIWGAALSRADMPAEKRNDFNLYIDEFQNFTTDTIASILSEARKYRLNLNITHQYVSQLVKDNDTRIRDAVFGNVGNIVSFRVGPEDGEFMEQQFTPVFTKHDLMNVSNFNAYVKLIIGGQVSRPFNMEIHRHWDPWHKAAEQIFGIQKDEKMAKAIKELSRLTYGRDRGEVEAEIKKRSKMT